MRWESLFPVYIATMTVDGNLLPVHRTVQAGEYVSQPFTSKEGVNALWEWMLYPQGRQGEEFVEMRAFLKILDGSPRAWTEQFPVIEGKFADILAGKVSWLQVDCERPYV